MIVAGLKEAEQVGGAAVVTLAEQLLVPPAPLSTWNVQVCVAEGVKLWVPLAVFRVPLPRLPVQL